MHIRGFPTGLSLVPPWCESILGLKVDAVQEDPRMGVFRGSDWPHF